MISVCWAVMFAGEFDNEVSTLGARSWRADRSIGSARKLS